MIRAHTYEDIKVVLHKRSGTSKWQFYYYDSYGKRQSALSTGIDIANDNNELALETARRIAARKLGISHPDVTLEEYAQDFYSWDGRWAVARRSLGRRVSQDQCRANQRILDDIIIPWLGHINLKEIRKTKVDSFRIFLFEHGYKPGTINKMLYALGHILKQAMDDEIIDKVPNIDKASTGNNRYGRFYKDEVDRIFDTEWKDKRLYMINYLAFNTGMRMGELMALKREDINLDEGTINVNKSYNHKRHIIQNGTKTGVIRTVVLSDTALNGLKNYLKSHPFQLVFPSDNDPDRPIGHDAILKSLKETLYKIGITEEERKRRNLVFHSWRHTCNSKMIEAGIQETMVQYFMGHAIQSGNMTRHYLHPEVSNNNIFRNIVNDIFNV